MKSSFCLHLAFPGHLHVLSLIQVRKGTVSFKAFIEFGHIKSVAVLKKKTINFFPTSNENVLADKLPVNLLFAVANDAAGNPEPGIPC